MKITKIMCAAVILIFASVFIGCKEDDGLSLPDGKKVSDLQDYDASLTTVDSKEEALNLLYNAITKGSGYGSNALFAMLGNANDDTYKAAFEKKYEMTQSLYFSENYNEKSVSFSVGIDDSEKLKERASVALASIKGSSSRTWKSNLTYGEYNSYFTTHKNDDWRSLSSSINKTFAITDGFYTFTSNSPTTTYKIAGVVTVEGKEYSKTTLKDSDTKKTEDSNDGSEKVSAALTVSNGTKAAKYRLSYSSEGNSNIRSANGYSGSILSDIEVYGNDNELLYTISGDNETASDIFSAFINNFYRFRD
jgi:hypothetical protein